MSDEVTGFTAKRFHLLQLTERAASVVPGKNISPLLSNFQAVIGNGRLRVCATDLELSVISETRLVTCRGEGTVLLPAKRFLQILRAAPEGDIEVRVFDSTAKITAGKYEGSLVLQDASDYPKDSLPSPEDIDFAVVSRSGLLDALSLVKKVASRAGTNPRLMAVSIKGGHIVAASHIRLHRVLLPSFPFDIQIPVGAVDDLARLLSASQLEEIGIGETDRLLVFRIGDDVFASGKMSGEYPDMEKRLLAGPLLENSQCLSVDKTDVLNAIRRVRITSDEKTAAIELRMAPGKVTVVSKDKNRNEAQEEIGATWTHRERSLIVNHEHLEDLLALLPGPVVTLRVAADQGKRRSPVLACDDGAGTAGVIGQLPALMME